MKAQQYHYPVGCDVLSRGRDIRWPNLLVLTDSTCRVSMSVKKKIVAWIATIFANTVSLFE